MIKLIVVKMKIGIDVSQIGFNGGVSFYTRELIKNISLLDKKNEYILFGSSFRHQQLFCQYNNNLPSRCTEKFFRFPHPLMELTWNFLHILPVEKFTGSLDLFHTSDWFEPPSECLKVTTIHDLIPYLYPETLTIRGVLNARTKLQWVKKEASLIIVDSENTKNDLKKILEIPEKKIKVIYLGYRKDFFPKSLKEIELVKNKYGIREDYIMTVGTQEPRKNLKRIIESFLKLPKLTKKSLSLVNVGRYGWGQDIKIPIDSKINNIGYVPEEDLSALYSGAKCLVYASLYEGFGLPILEAMSSGCPVVTSKTGSMPEVAGKAAILVDPTNNSEITLGIEEAIQDGNSLIKRGFERAKLFSWEKTARETLDVYKKIVG